MARKTTAQEVDSYLNQRHAYEYELITPGFENKNAIVIAESELKAVKILSKHYPAAKANFIQKFNKIHNDTRSATGKGISMGP
jgi:hypothetical protein